MFIVHISIDLSIYLSISLSLSRCVYTYMCVYTYIYVYIYIYILPMTKQCPAMVPGAIHSSGTAPGADRGAGCPHRTAGGRGERRGLAFHGGLGAVGDDLLMVTITSITPFLTFFLSFWPVSWRSVDPRWTDFFFRNMSLG